MDRGSLLGQAANVLVNIVGGNDMTLSEVQVVMEELAQHIGKQHAATVRRGGRSEARRPARRDADQFARQCASGDWPASEESPR